MKYILFVIWLLFAVNNYAQKVEIITPKGNEVFTCSTNQYIYINKFPYPFNPRTKIKYQLPVAGVVKLKVYDMIGNEISTLVDNYVNAGEYEVEFNANNLASGVYFYTLSSGNYKQTKKLLLLK
ncbi:MAG: T9SS type A sorting domain-containing protein [Melioribacteraceae bacterium]|nr:T9SS type A sorting domain-containing protein [Melioribacteraceae bacterium]